MTQISLSEIGYLTPRQVLDKCKSISSLLSNDFYVYPCHGVTIFGCGCGKAHSDPKEWGKHPSGGASSKLATIEPAAITWWLNNPLDNVAINPKMSGCVVIDIDPRSGGHLSWQRLIAEHGLEVPHTVKTLTGTTQFPDGSEMRGSHLWYKVKEGASFHGNLNHLGLYGIDIKHNGGVMAPPSRHGSGAIYEWGVAAAPNETAIADLPIELEALIIKTPGIPSSKNERVGYALPRSYSKLQVEELLAEPLLEGHRVVGIYQLTCKVAYRLGVDTPEEQDEVLRIMLQYNSEKVHPPLGNDCFDHVERHIRNAISWVASCGGSNES